MKRSLWLTIFLLIGAGILLVPVRTTALDRPEAVAQKADAAWLALVDAGNYAESWKDASAAFRAGVSESKWESMAQAVRSPLGNVETRKLRDATYTKTLPGAPDGNYVVAHYDTSFEHKQTAIETVISSLEKDGKWRVSGYFIK